MLISIIPLTLILLYGEVPDQSREPVLHCYGMMTQIATAARREFFDHEGFVVKAIYYFSTDPRSCAEETLRVQNIVLYERDSLGRPLKETHSGVHGRYVWRYEYSGSSARAIRRTRFGPTGRREYEIREADTGQSHIYFDAQERVIGIKGPLPEDLELAFEWGPVEDGWSCGVAVAPTDNSGGMTSYLHLQNASHRGSSARFVSYFESELRDDLGRFVPLKREFLAELHRMPASSWRGSRASRGQANFQTYNLQERYGVLPPGRYTLLVRHPHPVTGVQLVSNTFSFEITSR